MGRGCCDQVPGWGEGSVVTSSGGRGEGVGSRCQGDEGCCDQVTGGGGEGGVVTRSRWGGRGVL